MKEKLLNDHQFLILGPMKMIPGPISNIDQGDKERKLSECEKHCVLKCPIIISLSEEDGCQRRTCLRDCHREKQVTMAPWLSQGKSNIGEIMKQ